MTRTVHIRNKPGRLAFDSSRSCGVLHYMSRTGRRSAVCARDGLRGGVEKMRNSVHSARSSRRFRGCARRIISRLRPARVSPRFPPSTSAYTDFPCASRLGYVRRRRHRHAVVLTSATHWRGYGPSPPPGSESEGVIWDEQIDPDSPDWVKEVYAAAIDPQCKDVHAQELYRYETN